MVFRALAFFVLLWIVADLGDPAVPGVFSFASDRLFVDSVVQAKTAAHLAGTADCLPWLAAASPPLKPVVVKRPARAPVSCQLALYQHHHHPARPAATADVDRPDSDPLA